MFGGVGAYVEKKKLDLSVCFLVGVSLTVCPVTCVP